MLVRLFETVTKEIDSRITEWEETIVNCFRPSGLSTTGYLGVYLLNKLALWQ